MEAATTARSRLRRLAELRPERGRVLSIYFDLDPSTLWEEREEGLRCTVPSQTSRRPLGVRLSNTAAIDLSAWMVWDDEFGRPDLLVGQRRWAIPDACPDRH